MLVQWFRGILSMTAEVGRRLIGLFTIPTVAALAGSALTVYGLRMIYDPLAYLVPGAVLVLFGLWLAGLPMSKRGDD